MSPDSDSWPRDVERRLASIQAILDERGRQREHEIRSLNERIRELRSEFDDIRHRRGKQEQQEPNGFRAIFTDLRSIIIIVFVLGAMLGRAGIAPLEALLK